MNYTKGEWKPWQIECQHPNWTTNTEQWAICAGDSGEQGIAKTVLDDTILAIERKANANLIAAAPDMYEALQQLVDYLAYMGVPEDCEDKYAEAEQALAKAEGRE